MKNWQKTHITRNIARLIENTVCSRTFIAIFLQKGVFARCDIATLVLPKPATEISMTFYEMLVQRENSYNVLLNALRETAQTSALKILEKHGLQYVNYRNIMYDKQLVLVEGTFGVDVYGGEFGGRQVAVKVHNKKVLTDDVAHNEIKILLKSDHHPNILRYFTAKENSKFVFIVLEKCVIHLEDESKRKLIKISNLEVLRKCTRGIDYLHKNRIIHCGLRPSSVLITDHMEVKISDFGWSMQIPAADSTVINSLFAITQRNRWMSPEVLNSFDDNTQQLSVFIDIFSLGCIYYFLMSDGQHPFGVKELATMNNIASNKPEMQSTYVQEKWLTLIKKMVAHDPSERPKATKILRHHQATFKDLKTTEEQQDLLVIKNKSHLKYASDKCISNHKKARLT